MNGFLNNCFLHVRLRKLFVIRYMCLLIFVKWTIPWGEVPTSQAPSIINQMIDLPLAFGSTNDLPLWDK